MQMEEGLDTGPVFAQQSVSIKPEYTAQPLEQILANIGAELLLEVSATKLRKAHTVRLRAPASIVSSCPGSAVRLCG